MLLLIISSLQVKSYCLIRKELLLIMSELLFALVLLVILFLHNIYVEVIKKVVVPKHSHKTLT